MFSIRAGIDKSRPPASWLKSVGSLRILVIGNIRIWDRCFLILIICILFRYNTPVWSYLIVPLGDGINTWHVDVVVVILVLNHSLRRGATSRSGPLRRLLLILRSRDGSEHIAHVHMALIVCSSQDVLFSTRAAMSYGVKYLILWHLESPLGLLHLETSLTHIVHWLQLIRHSRILDWRLAVVQTTPDVVNFTQIIVSVLRILSFSVLVLGILLIF